MQVVSNLPHILALDIYVVAYSEKFPPDRCGREVVSAVCVVVLRLHCLLALVIGRCANPSAIPKAASELECKDGKLQGATLSDNGYVIIGMIYPVENSLPHMPKEGDKGYGARCEVKTELVTIRCVFVRACVSPLFVYDL